MCTNLQVRIFMDDMKQFYCQDKAPQKLFALLKVRLQMCSFLLVTRYDITAYLSLQTCLYRVAVAYLHILHFKALLTSKKGK